MPDYPGLDGAEGRILVASNNEHKVEEFRRILGPLGFEVVTPSSLGLAVQVDETGDTFAENAMLKAEAFLDASGMTAVADDSGLVVDALGGEPGVYSARYGGSGLDDGDRYRLLLERMAAVPAPHRTACFIASIALAAPSGARVAVEGSVHGLIAREARGGNGFGYDPIFYFPHAGRTFGEMEAAEKDAVSHRSVALRRLASALRDPVNAGILR
jgi:XTP/dITP diphosphohydrolase